MIYKIYGLCLPLKRVLEFVVPWIKLSQLSSINLKVPLNLFCFYRQHSEPYLHHEALDQWFLCLLRTTDIFNMVWDELLYQHHYSSLLDSVSDSKTRTQLQSVASSESGAWLVGLPVSFLGTKLDDESLRIAPVL